MLYYQKIDISDKIVPAKTNDSKECIIWNYWFFNHGFQFQYSVCNGCHYLMMMCLNISHISIITVKEVDYRCIIRGISESRGICLLENSVLDNCGYI